MNHRLCPAQSVGDFLGAQGSGDLIMGDLTWGLTHSFASTGQASADTANWFWDSGGTATDCNPSNPQLVRRCLDSKWVPNAGKVDWTKVSVDLPQLKIDLLQDDLDVGYLEFTDPGGTWHYRDSVAAKGTFLHEVTFDGLPEGMDAMDALKEQMLMIANPSGMDDANADVKIPYMLVEKSGGQAWVVVNDS